MHVSFMTLNGIPFLGAENEMFRLAASGLYRVFVGRQQDKSDRFFGIAFIDDVKHYYFNDISVRACLLHLTGLSHSWALSNYFFVRIETGTLVGTRVRVTSSFLVLYAMLFSSIVRFPYPTVRMSRRPNARPIGALYKAIET